MNHSETSPEERVSSRAVITVRTAEIVVAVTIGLLASLTLWSNYQLGAGWSPYGPEAGYFPMRLGIIILIASCFVLFHAIRANDRTAFLEVEQAKLVGVILLPLILYVFVIKYLGIYVSSAIFITTFMFFLGKFSWWKSLGLGVLIMIAFFFIFEIQFMVPLPKGPLENWLGY
tara:strand:+ start:730304 stop:730822 length:519 start_codon:yes stop_codon:yes gene_type:complete